MQRRSIALAALALALAPAVHAQANATTGFPNKPVRLVVTYPPGGTVDAVLVKRSVSMTPALRCECVARRFVGYFEATEVSR